MPSKKVTKIYKNWFTNSKTCGKVYSEANKNSHERGYGMKYYINEIDSNHEVTEDEAIQILTGEITLSGADFARVLSGEVKVKQGCVAVLMVEDDYDA